MSWAQSVAEFQSTLPVWGATRCSPSANPWRSDFNPRSPCGERPVRDQRSGGRPVQISIHAPRVGSDLLEAKGMLSHGISIHAPRVGSDGHGHGGGALPAPISIHAPRVGSDGGGPGKRRSGRDFNPRSPCGERPGSHAGENSLFLFQSTLPVWGATKPYEVISVNDVISIHAPRVGSDPNPAEDN